MVTGYPITYRPGRTSSRRLDGAPQPSAKCTFIPGTHTRALTNASWQKINGTFSCPTTTYNSSLHTAWTVPTPPHCRDITKRWAHPSHRASANSTSMALSATGQPNGSNKMGTTPLPPGSAFPDRTTPMTPLKTWPVCMPTRPYPNPLVPQKNSPTNHLPKETAVAAACPTLCFAKTIHKQPRNTTANGASTTTPTSA